MARGWTPAQRIAHSAKLRELNAVKRGGPLERRRVVYAQCTKAEHRAVTYFADKYHLTISDYVRRCINNMLIEESEDGVLLREFGEAPRVDAVGQRLGQPNLSTRDNASVVSSSAGAPRAAQESP